MKQSQRRGLIPPAAIGPLVERAAEALRQERFKEAVELFKQAIKQDPRPEWKQSLAEAYRGRARSLAAKGMFKEAAMVLENTQAADGTVRDPVLYLQWLVRDGQQQKAAAQALLYIGLDLALPADLRARLEDLTAALLVAVPVAAPAVGAGSERARWLDLAAAARDALAAWVGGAPAEEIEGKLTRISLRSPFRPVRLLLKGLLAGPADADRSRRMLEAIPQGSPFFPFRQAVEAALLAAQGLDADAWRRLSPLQQTFVAQTSGLPAATAQFLARSAEAGRTGPGALFSFLLKQSDLPKAELRSACLNLLPQVPDRLPQFEAAFGRLSELDRRRVQALAAEARGDWQMAERSWLAVIATLAGSDHQASLSRGVVYRHLADLAKMSPDIEGVSEDFDDSPVVTYLQRSCEADPDYLPATLELIAHYRDDDRPKDWYRAVDAAVQRFPESSAVLQQATEAAMARKAYKKAAGFAHRLLKIDPINAGVRRQMIELQVSHARKQMRAKRPDLAVRELASAAEWERADAPSAPLRIAHGLVELQGGGQQAEARLREGVELAGGGVGGWFRAAVEAELMKLGGEARLLRQELAQARETKPTVPAVMAMVSALSQPEAGENKRAIASLLLGLRPWLTRAASLEWSPAEFQAVSEALARFDAFDVLAEFAKAARKRDPGNPAWRFHAIVARTKGDSARLSMAEREELFDMAEAASHRQDYHMATRISKLLDKDGGGPFGRVRRRRGGGAPPPDDLDFGDIQSLVDSLVEGMPKRDLRGIVKELGRDGAVHMLADQLRSSPLGTIFPGPALRELCEAMVARAVDGSRSAPRAPARGSWF